MENLDQHIIRTLLYYDIFNYPLKSEEVFSFLGTNHIDKSLVQHGLRRLTQDHRVFQFGDFFSVQNNEALITRRVKGNAAAEKYMGLAKRKAKLISRFPFVRGVMASGSLSKGYMDENSDLDFFIVTEPNRLWIARMLLVMYKRIILFNSHKYFCVNYFVDTHHLEIEEKNIFTATELATVIPLYGAEYYHKLQQANPWLKNYFPNYIPRSTEKALPSSSRLLKKMIERLINLLGGNYLDSFFMRLTLNRWKKLYQKNYPETDFSVAFKTKTYASKNHPNHYQRKVLVLLEDKLKEFYSRIPEVPKTT